jgi:chemotaxis signal transduction protein
MIDSEEIARLRRAFDESFARPIEARAEPGDDVLIVRAGGERHAVRVSSVRQVVKCPAVTALPGTAAALAGVGAVRGQLVGVHDLALLLGSGGSSTARLEWLLLAGDGTVGLAVERLDGRARVVSGDVVTFEGASVGVLDVDALVASIGGERT